MDLDFLAIWSNRLWVSFLTVLAFLRKFHRLVNNFPVIKKSKTSTGGFHIVQDNEEMQT